MSGERPVTASLVLAAEAGNCNGCVAQPPPTPPDRKVLLLKVGSASVRLCRLCAARVEGELIVLGDKEGWA